MDKGFRFIPPSPSCLDWLGHLVELGKIDNGKREHIVSEIRAINEKSFVESPIYLRALSGIGAFISGSLVIYFLYTFGLFELAQLNLALSGLLLIGSATFLYHRGLSSVGLRQDFLFQIALTLLQAGKVALVTGLVDGAHEWFNVSWSWSIAAILGLVAILNFMLFPSSIERFIAALSFFLGLWASLLIDSPDQWEGGLFLVLLGMHLLGLAAFLKWGWMRRKLTSLYDALLVSLCIAVGIIATFVKLVAAGETTATFSSLSIGFSALAQKWPSQIMLTAALMLLVLWVAGRHRIGRNEPVLITCIGIMLLGIFSDPGIVLALGLMILGYATHRPIHSLLGVAFALAFGFYYYYALDLSLLQKSAILVISGLLLLAAAAYIYWRRWYQGPEMRFRHEENAQEEEVGSA